MISEGTSIIASPDSRTYNSIMEGPAGNIQNMVLVTDETYRLPGHAENVGSVNLAVNGSGFLQLEDSSEHITQPDKACGKELSLAEHQESSSVASSLEDNVNVDVTHNADTRGYTTGSDVKKCIDQEDNIVGVQTTGNNEVMAYSAGKESKHLPLGENMEFDPIRQHRHFCPWIVSIGSSAPGWKQTPFALFCQKDVSPSLYKSSPSASMLKVVIPLNQSGSSSHLNLYGKNIEAHSRIKLKYYFVAKKFCGYGQDCNATFSYMVGCTSREMMCFC
ncbi:hypothetical protein SLA2020_481790 [Shorea laevis]